MKTVYNFSDEAAQCINELAVRLNMPERDVISEALSVLRWIVKEHDEGSKILVARPTTIANLPLIGEIKGETINQVLFNKLNQPKEGY